MRRYRKAVNKRLASGALAVLLLIGVTLAWAPWAGAAQIQNRSIQIDNGHPGQVTRYTTSFRMQPGQTLGSIMIEFCANTALFDDPCDAPVGMDTSNPNILAQTGETGFTVDAARTTEHIIVLKRTPVPITNTDVSYETDTITNPGTEGSVFARISTFATDDASGSATDQGALALSTSDAFLISTEVPPYLIFCVGVEIDGTDCSTAQGSYVNLGVLTTQRAAYGVSRMLAGTNAQSGYAIRISGGDMASGNNIIPSLSAPTASAPGTSQFGINLRSNSDPTVGEEPFGTGLGAVAANYAQKDRYMFRNGDVLAGSTNADEYRKYTISYLANISAAQPPGLYNSTYTFIGLANF